MSTIPFLAASIASGSTFWSTFSIFQFWNISCESRQGLDEFWPTPAKLRYYLASLLLLNLTFFEISITFLKFFSFSIFFAFSNLSKVLSGPAYGNYVKGEIIRPSMLNFLCIFYIKILSLPFPPSCKNVCFIIVLSQRILYLYSCLLTISSLILLSKLAWFWLFSEICATSTKSRCCANYCDLI